jgi:hypothetical protein
MRVVQEVLNSESLPCQKRAAQAGLLRLEALTAQSTDNHIGVLNSDEGEKHG